MPSFLEHDEDAFRARQQIELPDDVRTLVVILARERQSRIRLQSNTAPSTPWSRPGTDRRARTSSSCIRSSAPASTASSESADRDRRSTSARCRRRGNARTRGSLPESAARLLDDELVGHFDRAAERHARLLHRKRRRRDGRRLRLFFAARGRARKAQDARARQAFPRTVFCIVKTVSVMSVKPERNQHYNPVAAPCLIC